MAHDVFISYSSKDSPLATAVCDYLETHGLPCWISPRDIPVGSSYPAEIVKAIKSARALVVILSGGANQSPHVANEIERASDNSVPIIPFRIENILPSDEIQYFLGRRHWLDALTGSPEQHLDPLLQAVTAILNPIPHTSTPQPRKNPVATQGETLYPVAGADVQIALPLTAREAAAGGKRYVMAGGRSVKIDLPPSVKDGEQSRYAGGGRPGQTGGAAGALIVTFHVTPDTATDRRETPPPHPQPPTSRSSYLLPLYIALGIALVYGLSLLLRTHH